MLFARSFSLESCYRRKTLEITRFSCKSCAAPMEKCGICKALGLWIDIIEKSAYNIKMEKFYCSGIYNEERIRKACFLFASYEYRNKWI